MPHGYNYRNAQQPLAWLEWGAYYEDMEDPIFGGAFDSPRAQDHFYTLTFQPPRIPAQVIGLTDNIETPFHKLGSNGTNSFAWAAIKGITPVTFVNPNDQTWPDARGYEFAALTSSTKNSREENLALLLDSLGHVLHLNQDLTSPDHVRNDNHYIDKHRYFENYGRDNYAANSQWFNHQPHGWSYWQSQGFTNLLNFWDTGKYTGASSDALVQEADGYVKLGLAEFCNGNFLGEDALYIEVVPASDPYHHFPFPSRDTSTQYKENWQNALTAIDGSFLKDGSSIQRVYLKKNGDGIKFDHHSVLGYLDVAALASPTSASLQRKLYTPTIDDSRVLQDYHSILIPKAVEYSAGILDYFFRGELAVSSDWEPYTEQYTISAFNYSSQTFTGGTFYLYSEDAGGLRTLVQQANVSTLAPNEFQDFIIQGPLEQATKFVLIYRGTIGSDPVDDGIGIAVNTFTLEPDGSCPDCDYDCYTDCCNCT